MYFEILKEKVCVWATAVLLHRAVRPSLWGWPSSPGCSPRAAMARLGVHQHSRGWRRLLKKEPDWRFRWRRKKEEASGRHPSVLFSFRPQKSLAAAPLPLLCCWLWLYRLWRPASAGLDFLTKPLGVRAATAAFGWCARPKLTQLTSLLSSLL